MNGFGNKKEKKVKSIKIDLTDTLEYKRKASDFVKNGNLIKAEQIYIQFLREGLFDQEIYSSLAYIYKSTGRLDKAIKNFNKALELSDKKANLFFNLGLVFLEKNELDSAIEVYKKGLELEPNNIYALINLANIYEEKSEFNLAIEVINHCIYLDQTNPRAIFTLGNILKSQGKYSESIKKYKEVISLDENFMEAKNNIGLVFHQAGRIDEGIEYFRNLISEYGANPKFLKNLSHMLLLKGFYKEGLEKYEARLEINKQNYFKVSNLEMWGNHISSNKNQLLVMSEQGLGDTIQFSRYLIPLKNQGIDVVFCVQDKLRELIKCSNIASKVYSENYIPKLRNAMWVPLLSIPRNLGVSPQNPIINKPYIKPPEKKIIEWKNLLRSNKKPIIGINWQGNPNTEKDNLKGRSLKLELFKDIAVKEINLVSLQKGFGVEQINTSSFKDKFIKLQNKITQNWDFLDNASIIYNCDLVITSDTSVAHLSGSMGKETWLLLQKIPDWRWGLNSEKSFWYPNMRLFRQNYSNNWDEVLQKVLLEFNQFLINF